MNRRVFSLEKSPVAFCRNNGAIVSLPGIAVGLLALVLVFVCLDSSVADNLSAQDSKVDETDAMFDSSRVLDVSVQMDPADWQKMRYEHHNLFFRNPAESGQERLSPYSYYKATVTINGKKVKNVGVRKKGLLGSVNAQRPSIKIHFDKYTKDERFSGLEMMTLNNNDADGNQFSQYLAYFLFNKAGIPAPRCSFAKVTVNGEFLGVYSHVESVRKRFLKRNFGSSKGDLYEGQISDFREEFEGSFQKKTNKKSKNRSVLNKVVRAMKRDDDELIERLNKVVALDDFYRYWAMESLIGFWDSYSGNTNNYFVYGDPSDDRIRFIPWGTDGAMRPGSGKSVDADNAKSVQANAALPYRLYNIAESQKRYRTELRKLLKSTWNEKELLTEIDNVKNLIEPHLHIPQEVFEEELDKLREFIKGRREVLMKELDGEAPPANGKLRVVQPGIKTAPGVLPSLECTFETQRIESAALQQLLKDKRLVFTKLPESKKQKLNVSGFMVDTR